MTNSTDSGLVPADVILDALAARGFRCEVDDTHVVATRDATRVVVPASGRPLPVTYVRRLEHALRPVLGAGWLESHPAGSHEAGTVELADPDAVVVLDAVVDRCDASGAWCAFLPSEVSLMGAGPTRDDALRDLKRATALWLGVRPAHVALLTPDVV